MKVVMLAMVAFGVLTLPAEARRSVKSYDGDPWSGSYRNMFQSRGSKPREVIHRITFGPGGIITTDHYRSRSFDDPRAPGHFGSDDYVDSYRDDDFFDDRFRWDSHTSARPAAYTPEKAISCKTAARQLKLAGYRNITVKECGKTHYAFSARSARRGSVLVKVSARNGEILSVRRQ